MIGVGWHWIFGLIGMILFFWLLIRTNSQDNQGGIPGYNSAMDILKKRYAGGEIRKKEFLEKRRDLNK
jgi:uncharacterized membrane protein